MSNKPKLYGFCDAGCKWETVHRDEFLSSAPMIPCSDLNGVYYLDPRKAYRIKKSTDFSNSGWGFRIDLVFTVNETGMPYSYTIFESDGKLDGANFPAVYKEYFPIRLCDLYSSEIAGHGVYRFAVVEHEGGTKIINMGEVSTAETYRNASLQVFGASGCYLINESGEVKARDGADGKDGKDGKDGAKGDSVFVRYSAYATGTDFTEEWTEGQDYMGVATGQTAPTDKSAYTWSRISTATQDGTRTVWFLDDGELYEAMTVPYSQPAMTSSDPVRDGYIFTGWKLQAYEDGGAMAVYESTWKADGSAGLFGAVNEALYLRDDSDAIVQTVFEDTSGDGYTNWDKVVEISRNSGVYSIMDAGWVIFHVSNPYTFGYVVNGVEVYSKRFELTPPKHGAWNANHNRWWFASVNRPCADFQGFVSVPLLHSGENHIKLVVRFKAGGTFYADGSSFGGGVCVLREYKVFVTE